MKFSLVSKTFLILICLFTFALPKKASAMDFGDAALTVGLASGVGAVLGASTLPFYATPGDNTKNIFYGAALGAVTGVILASFAALQDEKQDANAFVPRDQTLMAQSSAIIEHPHSVLENNPSAVWTQVTALRF